MGERVQPGCEIPRSTYKRLKNYVEDKHGTTRGNLGSELNRAIINHIEADREGGSAARIESDVATVNRNVADLKNQVRELAAALDEADADGGAYTLSEREPTDTHRDTDDGVSTPTSKPHPKASRVKKAEWLASRLDVEGEIHAEKDVGSLVDETYGFDGDSREKLVDAVIDRIDVVPSPRPFAGADGVLYATPAKAEEIREELREEAEDEADAASDKLDRATAAGDD